MPQNSYLHTLHNENVNFEVLIDNSDLVVAKAFKESIKNYFQSLSDNFDADLGREFLYRHTRKLDEYLIEMFKFVVRKSFGDYVPMQSTLPIILVALGSYGRQQLAVYSDIDIMILYKDIEGYNVKPLIERFVMTAWDAGLKVGHRVHEVAEIVKVSQTDHTIKTALLESRFLTGSKYLWAEYQNTLQSVRKTNPKEFAKQKIDEAKRRFLKYKVSMEPNIKEGKGGLRSGNTLFWLATSVYGISSNSELVDKLYTEAEYRDYRLALEFIFRLRIALHLEAGKKQDTLLMHYQRPVALKLGFKDVGNKRAEYALVARTLKSMLQVSFFCEAATQKMVRKIFYGENSISSLKSFKQINGFFINVDGCLVCSFFYKSLPLKDILQIILKIDKFISIDASVVYLLKKCENLGGYDAKFWIKFFSYKNSFLVTKALYDAGRLCDVLPQFEGIMHLGQYDGYHAHPADIHTLQCLKFSENIENSFAKDVFEKLNEFDKAFLKLLVVFHDIGKGRAQNHSIVGARMFGTFAKKAGFDTKDIEFGKNIILHHILMSDTALKEDLNSEKTILSFTSRLKTERAVKILFVLTYADMNGVSDKIYTFVNASLLKELYYKALDKLGKKELLFETAARLEKEEHLTKNEDFALLDKTTQKAIRAIRANLFFMKYDAKEIVSIAKRIKATTDYSYALSNEPVFSLEIISKKPINIGWLLGKLAFLDIVSMDVFKLFDSAKFFRVNFEEAMSEDDLPRIEEWIVHSFDLNLKAEYKRPAINRSGLILDCNHSNDYAKMQLLAKNQQGLLAFVIEVFDEFGIDIATAKISTIRQMARDMFLIEKSSGICEKKSKIFKRLCEFSQNERAK